MKTATTVQRIGFGLMWAAAVFAGPAGFAQQTNEIDSGKVATEAFASMFAADEARDAEDWAGAIAGYRDALEKYRLLAANFPDWEPEAVKFRISYCAGQIEAIGRATGQSAEELVAVAPAASPAGETAPGEFNALLQENQYLRQRVTEMDSEPGEGAAPAEAGEPAETAAPEADVADAAKADELAARVKQLDEERAALAAENASLKESLEKAIMEGPGAKAEEVPSSGAAEVLAKMREALAKERSGNYVVALETYGEILAARPAYAEALKGRGRCLLQMGKLDEAAAVLRGVSLSNRDDVQSRVLLGVALCRGEKYKAAVEVLTPLVVDDPSNAIVQSVIGAAWMGLGDARAARTALEKAVSLDSGLPEAQFNLAQVLLAAGPAELAKAREHYRKAITLGAPADPELQKRLGEP